MLNGITKVYTYSNSRMTKNDPPPLVTSLNYFQQTIISRSALQAQVCMRVEEKKYAWRGKTICMLPCEL